MDPGFLARGIGLGFAIAAAVGPISLLTIRRTAARPGAVAQTTERPGLPAAFASIFGLTLTNPMTILSFAGVFAAAGLAGHGGAEAALLTLGVFLGSLLWWILLTAIVARLRSRVTLRGLTWINRASGVALLVLGVFAVSTSLA